jgi:energy-coupling factor transport system ATP-binding protein
VFEVTSLSFAYPATSAILEDVSLSVNKHDVVLINGASGSGKSTLLNVIYGKHGFAKVNNFMTFNNRKLSEFTAEERWQNIGFITQYTDLQLCSDTVINELRFGLENLNLSEHEIEERTEKMLALAHLSDKRHVPVQHLSGGQKQKLIIVSILAMQPALILMDEPFAHLDVQSITDLVAFIADISKQASCAFIICEHRSTYLEAVATQQFTLKNGLLNRYKAYPEPYFCAEKPKPQSGFALQCTNLHVLVNEQCLVDHISLKIRRHERIAIMGENGSGKTTFIQSCFNLIDYSGTVEMVKAGLVFQNPDLMLIHSTLRKEIPSTRLRQQLDLEAFADQHPQTLSKGQRLRAAVATVLQTKPDLLFLDEVSSGQDVAHINAILQEIAQVDTLVFCTHDPDLALAFASRVLIFSHGKLVDELNSQQLTKAELMHRLLQASQKPAD